MCPFASVLKPSLEGPNILTASTDVQPDFRQFQLRGHAYATIDAAIQGHEYVEPACAAMREISEDLRKDEAYAPKILADIEIFGVERWELWGIGLRCRLKVLPFERDSVRREFTRRLIAEFDRRQIKSP